MTSKKSGGAGRVTIILIFILAAACAGFFFLGQGEKSTASEGKETAASTNFPVPENPPAYVRVEAVTDNKTVRESIVQNMSIEAQNRVQLTPRVSGRLERLHVKTGETVTKGQLVVTLEHAQQDALIGSTEAQVASANAETERMNAEMANAKTNLDRYGRLLKEGFSTQQQYDSMSTAYASARASYNAAVAKQRQASAELGRVKSAKQDYIMYSPLDGTVLSDYSLTQGTMISPSSPILDIADLRKLKASLRVPEIKIFAVKPGMDVILRFDAIPNEEFQGKVSRIDPYVDPATRSSAVEIELDNEAAGNRLRPGMFGQALMVEREFKNAVLIPANSIQSVGDGQFVFVEENSTAVIKPVKTGLSQGDYVQITEGLVSGDRLIVFGGTNLSDGDKVSVQ